MKNKGFTLVELLAVIAILAVLAILSVPRIIDIFNDAKKDAFLTETRNLYNAATTQYMNEYLRGNKINSFSSDGPNKLDLDNDTLNYYIEFDSDGKVIDIKVSNDEYGYEGTNVTESASIESALL